MLKPIVGQEYVSCDSAEPKSIEELNRLGINAVAVSKGKDSILHGIQWIQQHRIIVDKRCQNVINELSQYQWKKDKSGDSCLFQSTNTITGWMRSDIHTNLKLLGLLEGLILAKRLILKRDEITDKEFFRDIETNSKYRRVYGGVGWPSASAKGCAVILAEDLYNDYEAGTRKLHILDTVYDADPHGLIDQVAALQDSFCRLDWYGNTDSAWMRILADKNRELFRHRRASITIFKPPVFDSPTKFGVYSQLLKARVGGGIKTFFFNNSKTANDFQQPTGDTSKIDENIFPGIAAVLYALAAMDFRRVAE